MNDIDIFPRTPHLIGSALQKGDTKKGQAPLPQIRKAFPHANLFITEKLDGAQIGISYSDDLNQRLQSRGHYLTGGAGEAQFNIFKKWAQINDSTLMERLENRFTIYGEWCFARHSMFYDRLPHYLMVFDILDRVNMTFLDHHQRHDLLDGLPLSHAPLIADDWPDSEHEFQRLITRSAYQSTDWRDTLSVEASRAGIDPQKAIAECGDEADMMEGLYLKIEEEGRIVGRYKFVRQTFTQSISESGVHWSKRPLIKNNLADGVELFSLPSCGKNKDSHEP